MRELVVTARYEGRATAFALVLLLLPAISSADIGGVDGPSCVRLWVHALKTTPLPNSLYGVMRQSYADAPPFVKHADPTDFIAETCHIDRALAAVVIKDEVETSGLPQQWNLPQQSEPKENELCRLQMNDYAREYLGCKPRR